MNDSGVPRVTALLTTYRPSFEFLALAINSALCQAEPVHVLVSDSGCDDAVRAFVAQFGDRVSYRHNGGPVGPAQNHRLAIAEVRTPYVALLGHDDAWEPDFLSTLLPALDAHPECILAFSDHWFMDSAGRTDHAVTDRMSRHWGRSALREGVVSDAAGLLAAQAVPVAMAALLRTDAVQRHPIPDPAGPAYDIWLHYALASEGRPYWYSPRRLTQWRFHETGGTSVGSPEWYRGAAFTWESVCTDARFRAIQPVARHRAATAWLALAKSILRKDGSIGEAVTAARNSLAREPSLQARVAAGAPRLFRFILASSRR